MEAVKVIICGGRNYGDKENVFDTLEEVWRQIPFTHLIHGGASGADKLAGEWAQKVGLQVVVCPAKWDQHGRAAGPIRNRDMLQLKPALVVSFPGNRGTADMVAKAKTAGVRVMEVS